MRERAHCNFYYTSIRGHKSFMHTVYFGNKRYTPLFLRLSTKAGPIPL